MKKITRETELLSFVSRNPAHYFTDHVFRQDGFVVATDGHIMVRVPVDAVAGGEDIVEQDKPTVSSVIPKAFDKPRLLRIKDIETALEKAPKVDAQRECPECEGGGKVTWTYEGVEDDYEEEFRCPCCNGKGYVRDDGEPMPDPKQTFTMLDIKYKTKDLQRLIRAIGIGGARQAKILDHQYNRLYMEAGPVQILVAGIGENTFGKLIKVV